MISADIITSINITQVIDNLVDLQNILADVSILEEEDDSSAKQASPAAHVVTRTNVSSIFIYLLLYVL